MTVTQQILTIVMLALQLALQVCGQHPPIFGALTPSATPALPPTLTAVAPLAGVQGANVAVTLTGANLSNAYAINAGVGIAAVITAWSPTTVTAAFVIDPNAAVGAHNVTVTTPGGTSGGVTFSVTALAAAPSLTSISPASGVQGTSVPVTLNGANLTGTTSINAGTGITVSALTVVSSTQLTATFAIGGAAATGAQSVTATTPAGTSSAVTFTINPMMVTSVSIEPTNTQAIFRMPASAASCTVEVSQSATYLPLVADVDPALFAGAGTYSSNAGHWYVVGKRQVAASLANGARSRALQADTTHYYRVSCPGISQITGTFKTQTLQASTYIEPAGAAPLFDPTNRAEVQIDPLTGVALRKVTLPGDRVQTQRGTALTPAAETTGSTEASVAVSGATSSVALTWPAVTGATAYNIYRGTAPGGESAFYTSATNSYTDTGAASLPGTAPAASTAVLSAPGMPTLTASATGGSLAAGTYYYVVTAVQNAFPVTLSTAKTFFSADNTQSFMGPIAFLKTDPAANQYSLNYFQVQASYASTGATISGCLTLDGATCAANGNTYTATGGTQLTFGTTTVGDLWQKAGYPAYPASSAARVNGVPKFGVLLWLNAGTLALSSGTYNYQLGTRQQYPYGVAVDLCAAVTTLGPEGRPGYNCYLNQLGTMYWIDAVNGTVHLFARFANNTVSSANGCGAADSVIFDSVNPDTWYCGGNYYMPTNQQLWSFTYHGNHGEPPASYEEGTALPVCNSGATNTPCTTPVNLTAGSDLGTLTAAFEPNFQKDRFRYFYFNGVDDGKLIFRVMRSNQFSLGWTVVYDPKVPGVVAALSSWRSPGCRWCGQKSNEPLYTPGWLTVGPYPLGYGGQTGAGHGPYVVNATGAATAATCPSGFTGTCVTIPVSGEPYNLYPCTSDLSTCGGAYETSTPGELQAAAVGDEFTLDGTGGSSSERLALAAKTDATHWIFQRAINGVTSTLTGSNVLWTACNTNPTPTSLTAGAGPYWNYAVDPHAASQLSRDPYSVNAHFFYQNQTMAASYTADARCTSQVFGRNCYQVRTWTSIPNFIATAPQGILTLSPTFGGKYGLADGDQVQSHPSGAGLAATTAQKAYFFDARPFNGSSISDTATNVSGNVWKFLAANLHAMDRKYLPTFAYAGSHQLTDVSAPALNGAMATPWTYCVAAAANECMAASNIGDAYINAPGVTRNYCYTAGQATGLAYTETDLCLGNNSMVYNSVMQLPVGVVENTGAGFRALTHGFVTPRTQPVFDNTHAIPSGNYLLYDTVGVNGGAYDQIGLIQVPSQPAADAVVRTTFVSTPITVAALGGADNAVVEFGYAEYGGYCTSRAEACAVGAAAAQPFYFETLEAASLTGVACASGCTVNVPALSQHVLLGHVIYRAGTSTVGTGTAFAVAIP